MNRPGKNRRKSSQARKDDDRHAEGQLAVPDRESPVNDALSRATTGGAGGRWACVEGSPYGLPRQYPVIRV